MLIPSKLICSYRLPNSIRRERLCQLLDKSHLYPLVLVNAPAGYGKTTLISQWVATQQNVGWYSLDESDNKTERFAAYFSAALSNAIESKAQAIDEDSINLQANLLTSLNQLLLKVSQFKQHFYVIIDDYHLIENEEIHDALKYWIKHQPENMTLILISRSVPPLGIASLRVQEQLLEIDMHQLPFNHQESVAFFQSRLGSELAEKDIIALCDEVEGWPTALQLISLSAKQAITKNPESVTSPLQDTARRLAKSNNFHINEYLNDEVLNRVDNETRLFVLRCSILRSMNEELVQQVTGLPNSGKKLEELEKQGLFLQQMDSEDHWWRFHPLFASFLSHCRESELNGELEQLHRQAAQTWLKLGYTTEALYHAMQLTDNSTLLMILQQNGWTLFHQGELKLLEESLN